MHGSPLSLQACILEDMCTYLLGRHWGSDPDPGNQAFNLRWSRELSKLGAFECLPAVNCWVKTRGHELFNVHMMQCRYLSVDFALHSM